MEIFHTNSPDEEMDVDTESGSKNSDVIQSLKVKLTFYVYENFALSVIDQFFSIIIGKNLYINIYKVIEIYFCF